MTIPTRQWTDGIGTNGYGGYLTWNGDPVDALDEVTALIDLVADISNEHVIFDNFTAFTMASPTARPTPMAIAPLDIPGTVTFSAAALAIQNLYTCFDELFETFKFVILDCDTTPNFLKQHYSGLSAAEKAVFDKLSDDDSIWSSRAGARPNVLRSFTTKMNDKLRKEYNLS